MFVTKYYLAKIAVVYKNQSHIEKIYVQKISSHCINRDNPPPPPPKKKERYKKKEKYAMNEVMSVCFIACTYQLFSSSVISN